MDVELGTARTSHGERYSDHREPVEFYKPVEPAILDIAQIAEVSMSSVKRV